LSRPVLLVTRPAEEAGRTAAAAVAAGFDVVEAPLLTIGPVDFSVPPGAFDALLFTSARAPGLAVTRAPELLALPAYAVGARTAEALEAAGFRLARMGETDGSAILGLAAAAGVRRMLHLAGEATAPSEVPPGLEVVRVPVYAAQRVAALPLSALAALHEGRLLATLLFSARTARHFRRLAEAAGVDPGRQRIVALSPAVAEGAGKGWAAVAVSAAPDLDGALAAARGLWQTLNDGPERWALTMGNDNGR
jgi:uroporphyrinogen-III synthase